jgi:dihydropteroate synthase
MKWKTASRTITIDRPLVMGILNITPDSFSDGGRFASVDAALGRAEEMAAEGADIIDIGGESTRPGSSSVGTNVEIERVVPVIQAVSRQLDIPISIDTSKGEVAAAAIDAGAEIINDISGLRWDQSVASVASLSGAGLILMHSRGSYETMHASPPDVDIIEDVTNGIRASVSLAKELGVTDEQIAVDVGIGFGKTLEQNLELLRKLDTIVAEFEDYPLLIGTSRKSFIGKVLGDVAVGERLAGSLATAIGAAQKGAKILRVHDVKETVQALRMLAAIDK